MSCFCFTLDKKKEIYESENLPVSKPIRPPAPASTSIQAPAPAPAPTREAQPVRRPENPKQNNPPEEPMKKEISNGNVASQTFTFRELATATKSFRPECLIGEGGFGRVYKGILSTGQQVAVKQLDRSGFQGNNEFLVEVLMLSLLHHEHLVDLVGYCADGDQRLLVYEYMHLGSLEDHLLDLHPNKSPMSWYIRMKIALGAAKGLEYLHAKANPPVIYRDLKSSNILLGEDYLPKLSDFGLAKLGPVGDNVQVSTRVMGTYGYCAPEYARTGQLTPKSDVYSFGVVLLELITGKRVIDTTRPSDEQNLIDWAQPIFKDPRRFSELADPLLEGDFPERGLNQAVAVAAMCLNEEAEVRPHMTDVVTALSFLTAEQEIPDGSSSTRSSVSTESEDPSSEDDISAADQRRLAVAEAIQWGSSNSKRQHKGTDTFETE